MASSTCIVKRATCNVFVCQSGSTHFILVFVFFFFLLFWLQHRKCMIITRLVGKRWVGLWQSTYTGPVLDLPMRTLLDNAGLLCWRFRCAAHDISNLLEEERREAAEWEGSVRKHGNNVLGSAPFFPHAKSATLKVGFLLFFFFFWYSQSLVLTLVLMALDSSAQTTIRSR